MLSIILFILYSLTTTVTAVSDPGKHFLCKWDLQRDGCPLQTSETYVCLKGNAQCKSDLHFHCSEDKHGNVVTGCYNRIFCSAGTQPQLDSGRREVTCTICPADRYQPCGKYSNEFAVCENIKTECDLKYEHTIECFEGNATHDRTCRCDSDNDYVLVYYHRDPPTKYCKSDFRKMLRCIRSTVPCKDGKERLRNYRCSNPCPPGTKRENATFQCIQTARATSTLGPIHLHATPVSTTAFINPVTQGTLQNKTDAEQTEEVSSISYIAAGVVGGLATMVINIVVIFLCVICRKNKQRKKNNRDVEVPDEAVQLNAEQNNFDGNSDEEAELAYFDENSNEEAEGPGNCVLQADQRGVNNVMDMIDHKFIADAAKSVGIVICDSVVATGFRVGSKYIMVPWHVVKEICKLGMTPVQCMNTRVFESLRNARVDFRYESRGHHETRSYYFKPLVHFVMEDLADTAVLELEGVAIADFPPAFKNFGNINYHRECYLIGHSGGEVKASNRISFKQLLPPNCEEWSKNKTRNPNDNGFDGLRDEKCVEFSAKFGKGASGSPGVSRDDSGNVFVVLMFLRGYPQWYYDENVPKPDLTEEEKREYLIKQGVTMKTVSDCMKSKNPALWQDIFGRYYRTF